MAGRFRRIVSFSRYALLGGVVGAGIGALLASVLPTNGAATLEATVVVFHAPGSGLSDSGRDFLTATLAKSNFRSALAEQTQWSDESVTRTLEEVIVSADDASRPIAELHLRGNDADALKSRLDALAVAMGAHHRQLQQADLQWHLDKIDTTLSRLASERQALASKLKQYPALPGALEEDIKAFTQIVQRRIELELVSRTSLKVESAREAGKRQRSLRLLGGEERAARSSIENRSGTNAEHVEFELKHALLDAEHSALLATKQRLNKEFKAFRPLQIVRRAQVEPLETTGRSPVAAAAVGGLLGFILAGCAWSMRQSVDVRSNLSTIERSLRAPVLAKIADTLIEYGENEPLAATDINHLALAAIRSLRIALHILSTQEQHHGPCIVAALEDSHLGATLVANLATFAAHRGERVVVVNLHSAQAGTERQIGDGLIRYIQERDWRTEFNQEFDLVLIVADGLQSTSEWLARESGAIGLLVCSRNTPASALRKTRALPLDGVVLCGYPVDELAYLGAPAAI